MMKSHEVNQNMPKECVILEDVMVEDILKETVKYRHILQNNHLTHVNKHDNILQREHEDSCKHFCNYYFVGLLPDYCFC